MPSACTWLITTPIQSRSSGSSRRTRSSTASLALHYELLGQDTSWLVAAEEWSRPACPNSGRPADAPRPPLTQTEQVDEGSVSSEPARVKALAPQQEIGG